jgi:hypothetical protein
LAGFVVIAFRGTRNQVWITHTTEMGWVFGPIRQIEIDGVGTRGHEPIEMRVKRSMTVDVARPHYPAAAIACFFIAA